MGKLTAKEVETVGPGMHADGDGLYLQVGARDARSWIYRFKHSGKERYLGLGSAAAIPLKRARELAADARRLHAEGINPIERRREQRAASEAKDTKTLTFSQAAERFIGSHEAGWRNPKHRQQWRNTLATYAYPVLGHLLVHEVETVHVMNVLEPIWRTKPETASRIRGRIEQVLNWAKAMRLREGENPAQWRGHLDNLLPARSKVRAVKHHAALPYGDLPAFLKALRARPSISARALEFVILTAARSGEAMRAQRGEIDTKAAIWTVPASRMKAGKEHRVPLSADALAVLESLPRDDEPHDKEWVFHSFKGSLTEAALSKMLALMGRADLTVHGFRSTFRDWAAETTAYPNHVVEMCLAHAIGDKVEAAYRRGDLFEKRRRLMDEWVKYCSGSAASGDNVVALRG